MTSKQYSGEMENNNKGTYLYVMSYVMQGEMNNYKKGSGGMGIGDSLLISGGLGQYYI